jgi:hypothetical protein
MLNFAERTGCGAVIVVWSFLHYNKRQSIANDAEEATPAQHFRQSPLRRCDGKWERIGMWIVGRSLGWVRSTRIQCFRVIEHLIERC